MARKSARPKIRTFLRHYMTTQESKAVPTSEEQGVKVRGKRQAANLPNLYDDGFPHFERNWKRHRKTKYKVIACLT